MFSNNEEKRSDIEIQSAVKAQFLGIAPERQIELEQLWGKYDLQFSLLADGDSVEMRGGLYRHVEFNHRVLKIFWISAFAAWEAYSAYFAALENGGDVQLVRLKQLIDCALLVQNSENPDAVPLPGIPMPGDFPEPHLQPELRAACECAVFVAGWAMLHEVRHVQHQQDGTSSTDLSVEEKHSEEYSCDEFATNFILENISEYSTQKNEDIILVGRKRRIGIYFALFALVILSRDQWQESETHPSLQDRIDTVCGLMQGSGNDEALAIAILAFKSLNALWPNAPFVKMIANAK